MQLSSEIVVTSNKGLIPRKLYLLDDDDDDNDALDNDEDYCS